jgi:hypothetical protein
MLLFVCVTMGILYVFLQRITGTRRMKPATDWMTEVFGVPENSAIPFVAPGSPGLSIP